MTAFEYKAKYSPYRKFIDEYSEASNAATGSKFDSNANVENKNVTTCTGELFKKDAIGTNRLRMIEKITELYGEDLAEEYIRQLDSHEIYRHDETHPLYPYTYGGNNRIHVRYNGESFLTTFASLYELCDGEEECLDNVNGVWAKYPVSMTITDRYGLTNVQRLIKKRRHREMVEVVTSDGYKIVVTDNHPMIVSDDIDNTVDARNVLGCQQLTFSMYQTSEWSTVTEVNEVENQDEYIYDITTESHTFICNGLWVHNCVSITMYPFLCEGLTNIGGVSEAPKNLDSFCGSFVNLVFAVASQFAGAVATPEFLMYMDYFLRKEFGDDYYTKPDTVVTQVGRQRTIQSIIDDKFSQVVYSLNQPAAARNFQSVFWNIAYFDHNYFSGMFNNFAFPDGTVPCWDSVNWLQKHFMKWFNAERLKKVLTFPVETVNLLDNGSEYVDKEWEDFTAEMWAEGHSFFCYRSNSVDSQSSCCRQRNEIAENTFSYTLGAGGIATGSKGVITININRLVQNATRNNTDISDSVLEQADKCHKYLTAWNEILKEEFNNRMLPIYDAGYISMASQYLTLGINGFVEGAEFLGIDPTPNSKYFEYGEMILKPIYESNKTAKTDELMFNTEFVPAENLGVKYAMYDKADGYFVPRDCYNSYFYRVEDNTVNILDKFILHGGKLTRYLDGGSALHANLEEHLTKEQYLKLMKVAIVTGCSYFTFNIPNTICNKCGHISKHNLKKCPKCGSEDVDYITRIIGYLKRVSNFSEKRQEEAKRRYYAKPGFDADK